MHGPLGSGTGRVGIESTGSDLAQDGLGHDAAGRVTGAQEQDVVRTLHCYPQQLVFDLAGACSTFACAGPQHCVALVPHALSVAASAVPSYIGTLSRV